MTTDALRPEYRTVKGKRMVLLPEADFESLVRRADLWEPALPEADAQGNRPADEYAAISQARAILHPPKTWPHPSGAGPTRRHPPRNLEPNRTGPKQA